MIILGEGFCNALLDIANCLVLVGKARAGTPPPRNTNSDIANAVIYKCVNGFSEELWGSLPFFLNYLEAVKQFCVELEAAYGVQFTAMIKRKIGPSEESDKN